MASTRKLIDEWTEAGLPREQATRMVHALDGYLVGRDVSRTATCAAFRELSADIDAMLAAFEKRLTIKFAFVLLVQLVVASAIARL